MINEIIPNYSELNYEQLADKIIELFKLKNTSNDFANEYMAKTISMKFIDNILKTDNCEKNKDLLINAKIYIYKSINH